MSFLPLSPVFDMFDVMRTRFFQGLENELNQVRDATRNENFKSKQVSYSEHRLADGTIVSDSTQTKVVNNVSTTVRVQRVGDRELKTITTTRTGEKPTTERFIKNMEPSQVPQFLTDFSQDPYEEPEVQPDGWRRLE
jgi:hypothetical protein